MKQAVIDLGTNTFHLMIEEREGTAPPRVLFRESRPAKLGKAGINRGLITEEAMERALTVLRYFGQQLDQFGIAPETVTTIGTSAIRVAGNQADFIERVRQATGLQIRVVSGDEEAELIYRGVRASGALGAATSLVMDIGGGSVEFILGNQERIFWKQSFEMGGQRLLERFMPDYTHTISPSAIGRLHDFFREQLVPLHNAVHQYQPTVLVGSSGSFDTLVDMDYQHRTGQWPPAEQASFKLPVAEFYRAYSELVTRNHDQRMQLPGMIELRVDMIVVAVCLIDYVLKAFEINTIRVSTYALKEGVLAQLTEH
ncbi:MAG: phosphatase [Bacteroidetes bacterium]|nr:phosphatase [Fibrella sp.]